MPQTFSKTVQAQRDALRLVRNAKLEHIFRTASPHMGNASKGAPTPPGKK